MDRREWLVTNGLGGYASGTVDGTPTRRYHALLVAALPPPLGRRVLLTRLLVEGLSPENLRTFALDRGLPVWTFEAAPDAVVEQRVVLVHGRNAAAIRLRLLEGTLPQGLRVTPALHFRPADGPLAGLGTAPTAVRRDRVLVVTDGDGPALHLQLPTGTRFTDAPRWLAPTELPEERARGYDAIETTWTPGAIEVPLAIGGDALFVASCDGDFGPSDPIAAEIDRREALLEAATTAAPRDLVLAADAFLVTPPGRASRVGGSRQRAVVAGYHWFTDWGRDTMIALEGLTIPTGRHAEAREILRAFATHVRDGLVPNLFPEGATEGLYNTADATLWYFHALHRYVVATGDQETLHALLPTLREIVAKHLQGTRFGIGVDPTDGLLTQGAEGLQLTWMDAKVGDWVVTPRRGKAVEINALWFNALKLLAGWTGDDELERRAQRVRESFNRRFWCEAKGHLFDVVDGEHGHDACCRPNQVFAISLDHPVLDASRWAAVVAVVRDRLVTPLGLRSLAPGEPGYAPRYEGDVRSRDAAYHQGTVWAWLIGPFVDAWLKVHPGDRSGARSFVAHLEEAGVGSVSEVFDGDPPHAPRGCIAQAWSVAEVLRTCARSAADGDGAGSGVVPPSRD